MKRWCNEILCPALAVTLPLASWPIAWLPFTQAQYRFSLMLPIAAMGSAILLVVASRRILNGDLALCPAPALWPLLCIAGSWLVSVRFSRHPHLSISMLAGLVSNSVIFLAASRFPEENLRGLCKIWVAAAALVAVNGLVRLGSEAEFISTIGNRNFLAAYLAASVVIGVSVGTVSCALACAVMTAALYFCRSRGAWSALGTVSCGLLSYVALVGRGWGRARFIGWVAAALVLAAAVSLLGRASIERLVRQDVRPLIWQGTTDMIAARPAVGHGLGTFAVEYPRYRVPEYFLRPKSANATDHAHNELLETATEQGVVGLAATIWLWSACIWLGLRAARLTTNQTKLRLGLVGATAVFMLHGMVDVDLRFPPNQTLLWLLMGLLVGGSHQQPVYITLRSRPARLISAGLLIMAAVWITMGSVVQPVRADFWERRARLAEAHGDMISAATAAERALAVQPFRVGTRYYYAGLLARIPVPRARMLAIEECLRIEELAPDYGDITFNLGQLYLAEDRAADAEPYLARAVHINPYNAEKRFKLAEAMRNMGQSESAIRELRQALRLDPSHAGARELLDALSPDKSAIRAVE